MERRKMVAALAAASVAACSRRRRGLTVGAKSSTEQAILAEIVAQHLEHRLRIQVNRRPNLGGTLLAHQALMTGYVDLYPEYSGLALTIILRLSHESDPSIVFERVRNEYRRRSAVEWLDRLGFAGGYAVVVRAEDARAGKLETLTDAAGYAPRWALGVSQEFLEQPALFRRLLSVYGLPLAAAPRVIEPEALYQALARDEVNMVAGSPTDGMLVAPGFKVLADDQNAFPPCQAALAVRAEALDRHAGLRSALAELSGRFSTETVRSLSHQVDAERRAAPQVAVGFLRQTGLIP